MPPRSHLAATLVRVRAGVGVGVGVRAGVGVGVGVRVRVGVRVGVRVRVKVSLPSRHLARARRKSDLVSAGSSSSTLSHGDTGRYSEI